MRLFFLLLTITISLASIAQKKVLSTIPSSGKTIEAFIPEGYDTMATASGDLNKDKANDIVLVLKSKEEETIDPATGNVDSLPPRLLLVLFKNAGGYKLAAKNGAAVLCKFCGGVFGDPFESIAIEKGVLVLHHYGGSAWRWSLTHKFRYQQNDFYLIGETDHAYWSVNFCEQLDDFAGTTFKDTNLLTGGYEEKEITEECKLIKNKKGKQKVKPLKKLSAFTIEN